MTLRNKILSIIIFLCLSCNRRVLLNELAEKELIYYRQDDKKPFTGKVFSVDKTLRGKSFTSSMYTFKNGIPEGNWETYAAEEIIQKGTFYPITDLSDLRAFFPYLNRINICRYIEGDLNLIDIYAISKNIDTTNFNSNKNRILEYLIQKKYLAASDTTLINSCSLYSGEF
jgi:antitoxin component YwqK of YwqJK toxin-antitoxin module